MEESVAVPRSPAPLRSRATPALLFALLVLAVWADPLFFRHNFAGRDLIAYNFPLEKVIHDAYARGKFPLWESEISGGRPLLPNPNAGAMYPPRILLSRVPFPMAMRIFPILHWAAAGVGVILLLSSIGVSRAGAWVGAVSYAFSGVVISEVFFPHILPGMALLPWIVWAVRRPPVPMASKVFLLSFLITLDILAGDVFTISVALFAGALWIAREEDRNLMRRQFLALAAAIALAMLAALPQIVATALWIPETNRAVMGMKWGEVLQFSISPYRLLELVIPYPFGSLWMIDYRTIWGFEIFNLRMMGLFVTLYAGAFAIIALFATWRSSPRGARFARTLILVSILLAVPVSLVPTSWRQSPSPLPLRNPEKFAVAIVFGLAVLAGPAFDKLRARRSLPRWILGVGVALGLTAGAATLWPRAAGRAAIALTPVRRENLPVAAQELPLAFSEAALYWLITWMALELARSGRRAAIGGSLLLLTAVPIASNRRIPRIFREEEVFAPPAFVRFLWKHDPQGQYRTIGVSIYRLTGQVEQGQAGSDPSFLEYQRRNWTQHAQVLWGRGTVFNGDFDAGDLSRIESVRKVSSIAARYRDGGPFFESFSLRWGTRYRDHAPLPGYHRIGGNLVEDWDELPGALPDIRLALGAREVPGALAALQEISKLKRGEIVVETGSRAGATSPPGTVRIIEKHPERLMLETECGANSWLFVLRGFWNHRTVRVDGRETDVFPAQLAFSAIPVPAGRHRVEWEEHFPGWSVSRVGPVLAVLAVAFLFIRERRPRSGA